MNESEFLVERIKGRYRYELRDPALPQTTVDDMTALLDSHDEQKREIERLAGIVERRNATYTKPNEGWVCFHCGERFVSYEEAREHFGEAPDKKACCRTEITSEMPDYTQKANAVREIVRSYDLGHRPACSFACCCPEVVRVLRRFCKVLA